MKKYKLIKTDKIGLLGGTVLYRIKRLSDGVLGGYIESESNLSQEGEAWVYSNAQVYGSAWVSGHAKVSGNAQVHGNAQVYGNAQVSGSAWVSGHAKVYGNARVSGSAWVSGHAKVYGNAQVYGSAWVSKSHHCVNITGFNYNITVTPQNICIGCKVETHSAWLKITKRKAVKLGLPAAEYGILKAMLKQAIKQVSQE